MLNNLLNEFCTLAVISLSVFSRNAMTDFKFLSRDYSVCEPSDLITVLSPLKAYFNSVKNVAFDYCIKDKCCNFIFLNFFVENNMSMIQ